MTYSEKNYLIPIQAPSLFVTCESCLHPVMAPSSAITRMPQMKIHKIDLVLVNVKLVLGKKSRIYTGDRGTVIGFHPFQEADEWIIGWQKVFHLTHMLHDAQKYLAYHLV